MLIGRQPETYKGCYLNCRRVEVDGHDIVACDGHYHVNCRKNDEGYINHQLGRIEKSQGDVPVLAVTDVIDFHEREQPQEGTRTPHQGRQLETSCKVWRVRMPGYVQVLLL